MFYWFFLLCQPLSAQISLRPQPVGQLGEREHSYLVNKANYLQVFNNDFLGNTDKHLTHSTGFSYTNQSKWEFGIYRRLTTPALSYDYFSPPLKQPYGILSDDTTFNVATFMSIKSNWVLYPELSLNIIGNQNAKQIYNFVHQSIGSPLNYDLYGPEQKIITLSGGLKAVYEDSYYFSGIGLYTSPYMDDLYLIGGLRYISDSFAVSTQYKLVNQINSRFYKSEIKNFRQEWQLGFRFNWYLMFIGYNSNFLKHDPIGQYFIAPLNIQFNW